MLKDHLSPFSLGTARKMHNQLRLTADSSIEEQFLPQDIKRLAHRNSDQVDKQLLQGDVGPAEGVKDE